MYNKIIFLLEKLISPCFVRQRFWLPTILYLPTLTPWMWVLHPRVENFELTPSRAYGPKSHVFRKEISGCLQIWLGLLRKSKAFQDKKSHTCDSDKVGRYAFPPLNIHFSNLTSQDDKGLVHLISSFFIMNLKLMQKILLITKSTLQLFQQPFYSPSKWRVCFEYFKTYLDFIPQSLEYQFSKLFHLWERVHWGYTIPKHIAIIQQLAQA